VDHPSKIPRKPPDGQMRSYMMIPELTREMKVEEKRKQWREKSPVP
jgi:hypothetical protein